MLENIKIDSNSSVPKYKQIIESIHQALENKTLEKNEKIASINEVCKKFTLSRDTVLMAFGHLQSRGIIESKPGKGYYVKKIITTQKHKIFLLFDRLSPYKEVLYDSFKEQLKNNGTVEIFFHNFNLKIFETLIKDNLGSYTDYVIMPIPSKSITPTLNLIPKDKLYILDRGRRLFGQHYSSVCQSFKEDIYNALDSGKNLLEKYNKMLLIFSDYGHVPMDLQRGFIKYCSEKNMVYSIIKDVQENKIQKGEVYLVLDDKNLVKLVQESYKKKLKLGRDIGIISYNDTPLKSIVASGITTISTDFAAMGKSMADLIINKKKDHIENPCSLIRRHSL